MKCWVGDGEGRVEVRDLEVEDAEVVEAGVDGPLSPWVRIFPANLPRGLVNYPALGCCLSPRGEANGCWLIFEHLWRYRNFKRSEILN